MQNLVLLSKKCYYFKTFAFSVDDLPTSIYNHKMLPLPGSNGAMIIHHSGVYHIQCNNGGCQDSDWKQFSTNIFPANYKVFAALKLPSCIGKFILKKY